MSSNLNSEVRREKRAKQPLLHSHLVIKALFSDQPSPLSPTHPPILGSGLFVPMPSGTKPVLSEAQGREIASVAWKTSEGQSVIVHCQVFA